MRQFLSRIMVSLVVTCLGLNPLSAVESMRLASFASTRMAFVREALAPPTEISQRLSPQASVAVYHWLEENVHINRRETIGMMVAGLFFGVTGGSLSGVELEYKKKYKQALRSTNVLKKIEILQALRKLPEAASILPQILNNLWILQYLIGDYAAAEKSLLDQMRFMGQSVEDQMDLNLFLYPLILLYSFQDRWDEAAALCGKQLILQDGKDDKEVVVALLKQIHLARGDYEGFLELPSGTRPDQITFENKVRALKKFWDQEKLPYLPWLVLPLKDHVAYAPLLSSIGDRRRWSLRREIPVRVYVNFASARSTAIPYAYFLKATWNPLYQAFKNKDVAFIRERMEDISTLLSKVSGGRCSLKFEAVQFAGPEPAIKDQKLETAFELAAAPDVRAQTERGFTFFVGDFPALEKGPVSEFSAYGNGLVFIRPFEREAITGIHHFLPMSSIPFLVTHELAHGFGMIHRFGRFMDAYLRGLLETYPQRFPSNEETKEALDQSYINVFTKRNWHRVTISQINQLRTGWIQTTGETVVPRTNQAMKSAA